MILREYLASRLFLLWIFLFYYFHSVTRAACTSKEEILDLLPLIQESDFEETFRSTTLVQAPQGERPALLAQFYYDESNVYLNTTQVNGLFWNRYKSDATFHYAMGNAATIYQLHEINNTHSNVTIPTILGPNVLEGHVVQLTVPAQTWYTVVVNTVKNSSEYARTLIGVAMGPGWEEGDWEGTYQFNINPPQVVANTDSILAYCHTSGLPTVDELVALYNLQPHPEGGFFVETFRSNIDVAAPWGNRSAVTAIYYLMVSSDGEHSDFHRLRSDETWSYYFGDPVNLYLLDNNEQIMQTIVLGTNLTVGEVPQYTVPAGVWFGAEVPPGGSASYGFVGTNVGPGFEYTDWELGVRSELMKAYPEASETIHRLTPPADEEGGEGEDSSSNAEMTDAKGANKTDNEERDDSDAGATSSFAPSSFYVTNGLTRLQLMLSLSILFSRASA